MRTFRTTALLLALLVLASSCRKEHEPAAAESWDLTATIEGQESTRVTTQSYSVDSDYNISSVSLGWEIGDILYGMDDRGTSITCRVIDVVSGVSTLEFTDAFPADDATKLHLYYAPGITGDFSGSGLAVNLEDMDVDERVILCATADITKSLGIRKVSLVFENQMSAIVFQNVLYYQNEAVTQISLEGVVGSGTLKLVDGQLKLVPGTTTSTLDTYGNWVAGETGNVAKATVYVMPNSTPSDISVTMSGYVSGHSVSKSFTGKTLSKGKFSLVTSMSEMEIPAEALVGAERYATISDALAAAGNGDTVTLLKDCELTKTAHIANDFTLNLNEHTIAEGGFYLSVEGGNLTVAGEGLIFQSQSNPAIYIAGGSVTMESGTVQFVNSGLASVYVNGGSFIMNGGKLVATKSNGFAAIALSGSMSVSGNSVLTSYDCNTVYVQDASVDVQGGYFYSESSNPPSYYNIFYCAGSGTISISGGYYNHSVSSYVVSGKSCVYGSWIYDGKTYTYHVQ